MQGDNRDMIDDNKINIGFDELDTAMEKIVNIHKLNMFEVLTILAMMDMKVKQSNINQYLLETVTRFQKDVNNEDGI